MAHKRTDAPRTVRRTRCDRSDAIDLKRAVRTDEGYVFASGRAMRAGVLAYKQRDGSIRRELVPWSELSRKDSLATLGNKPVTVEHPRNRVNPSNWSAHAAGSVSPKIRAVGESSGDYVGGYVQVDVSIMRADAIDKFDDGEVELSAVYDCDTVETPGVWQGPNGPEPYDAIQTNRRYRELAITSKARGGRTLRLRADSDGVQVDDVPADGANRSAPTARRARAMNPILLLALASFGVTRTDSEEDAAEKIDAAADELAKLRKADKVRTDSANEQARRTTAELNAYGRERHSLLVDAEAAGLRLDSDKVDTWTNEELAAEVVKGIDPKVKEADLKNPTYCRVRLDSLREDGRIGKGSQAQGAHRGTLRDEPRGADPRARTRSSQPATGYPVDRASTRLDSDNARPSDSFGGSSGTSASRSALEKSRSAR